METRQKKWQHRGLFALVSQRGRGGAGYQEEPEDEEQEAEEPWDTDGGSRP